MIYTNEVVQKTLVAAVIVVLSGCNGNSSKPGNPSPSPPTGVVLAADFPQFAKKENEVQIADSFNEVDPTFVIGALVDTKTGRVRSLDSYLRKDAKPKQTTQTELAFKNFIENSVAANAAWLDFVKAQVNDKVRAEVTVIKSAKVTIDSSAIDKEALVNELRRVPAEQRENYGIIVGYVDYVLSASYFRDTGADISASGYGAKIGTVWYSKYENSSAHHRLVAVWAPLPFVLELPPTNDVSSAISNAIKAGTTDVKKITADITFPK